jgi:hypothetical protein
MFRNSDLHEIIADIKKLGGPVENRQLIATRLLEMGIDRTPSEMYVGAAPPAAAACISSLCRPRCLSLLSIATVCTRTSRSMVDSAFVSLLKGRAIGQDSVVKGVAILLEEEVFDTFMKDSKLSASYFAMMLRSLVLRQVRLVKFKWPLCWLYACSAMLSALLHLAGPPCVLLAQRNRDHPGRGQHAAGGLL